MTKPATARKPAKKASKGGRPTKLNVKMKERLKEGYLLGLTDVQVCKIVDINESTLTKWKQKFPEFFMSIRDWKAQADKKVETSLYERACGYSHPDTKAQWVETSVLEGDQWIKVGRWEYADLVKHYPPDSTSMIFWLKNRQPEKWRDVQKLEHSVGDVDMVQVVNALMKIEREPASA